MILKLIYKSTLTCILWLILLSVLSAFLISCEKRAISHHTDNVENSNDKKEILQSLNYIFIKGTNEDIRRVMFALRCRTYSERGGSGLTKDAYFDILFELIQKYKEVENQREKSSIRWTISTLLKELTSRNLTLYDNEELNYWKIQLYEIDKLTTETLMASKSIDTRVNRSWNEFIIKDWKIRLGGRSPLKSAEEQKIIDEIFISGEYHQLLQRDKEIEGTHLRGAGVEGESASVVK